MYQVFMPSESVWTFNANFHFVPLSIEVVLSLGLGHNMDYVPIYSQPCRAGESNQDAYEQCLPEINLNIL